MSRRAVWVNALMSTYASCACLPCLCHFRGPLKPPFNDAARAQAGFGPEWYLPLAADAEDSAAASAAADSSGHACKGQQQGPAHTAAVACLERCNMTARHM